MKPRRLLAGSAVLLIVMLFVGGLSSFIRVRQYPTADRVLPVVHSFLETKGYRLVLQGRNDVTHTTPPLFLRLWGIPRSIRDSRIRLGGVGAPYEHGYICKYRSGGEEEIQVAIDVRGGLAYRVTLIGGTNTSGLFPEFAGSIQMLRIPVGVEPAHGPLPGRQQ